MKKKTTCLDVEIKKANILYHCAEADIFEKVHPEGSSVYERFQVLRNVSLIKDKASVCELCLDVGCGTGFVTSFELPFYNDVVAVDISRKMLDVVKKRFGHLKALNLIVCDAESLPLKNQVADLVSVSSVLHHLPKPFHSMMEISRVLKQGGFLYVTREPNLQRFRRFFSFFDDVIVRNLLKLLRKLSILGSGLPEYRPTVEGLDDANVDVHYSEGFNLAQLADFLRSKSFGLVSACSYHWIYPSAGDGMIQQVLSKSNFVIGSLPYSNRLGRYVCLIAKKLD